MEANEAKKMSYLISYVQVEQDIQPPLIFPRRFEIFAEYQLEFRNRWPCSPTACALESILPKPPPKRSRRYRLR